MEKNQYAFKGILTKILIKDNVIVSVNICGTIDFPIDRTFDVIRIIVEFFTNARKEIERQQSAYLQVCVVQNEDEIIFQISNSLHKETDNYFEVVQKKNGGFKMIDLITESSPHLQHAHYISPVLYRGWSLFYQELHMRIEKG